MIKPEREFTRLYKEHWSYIRTLLIKHNISYSDFMVAEDNYRRGARDGWAGKELLRTNQNIAGFHYLTAY